MATMYPSSNNYFQHDNHVTRQTPSQTDFMNDDNEFNVTGSESNRTPFGCGRTGDSQIYRNCVVQSCQQGKESQRNLLESVPRRIEAVLRANKVLSECVCTRTHTDTHVYALDTTGDWHVDSATYFYVYFWSVKWWTVHKESGNEDKHFRNRQIQKSRNGKCLKLYKCLLLGWYIKLYAQLAICI